MARRILILGGYGNAGWAIAQLLAQYTEVDLVIAGRNLYKAQQAAQTLTQKFPGRHISSSDIDAADSVSLESGFKEVDLVVVASSTTSYAGNVAKAALDAGIDYLDVQLSSPDKLETLMKLKPEIERKGLCFITDGGFHPGVPAAMVRYAASKLYSLEAANVSASMSINWKDLQFSDATIAEFADELREFNPLILKNGEWVKGKLSGLPKFEFGAPFGKRSCTPMFLHELKELPDALHALKDMGFYIAGFNWVTNYLIMPVAFIATHLFGQSASGWTSKLFAWGLKNFSKPPYLVVLQVEATGTIDERERTLHLRLTHEDPYLLTAAPVVACVMQYLDMDNGQHGLWLQGCFVEPERFFKDIERLGVLLEKHSDQTKD